MYGLSRLESSRTALFKRRSLCLIACKRIKHLLALLEWELTAQVKLRASAVQVDKFNHKMAAVLVSHFMNWKSYTSDRGTLMKEQLLRISREPSISSEVLGLVMGMLGQ